MKKRKSAGSKMHFLLLHIALLAFAVYTIYSMISLQAVLAKNREILDNKNKEISQRQITNSELEHLLTKSKDEIIERAAREKLDYVYQNEEVYEDIAGK